VEFIYNFDRRRHRKQPFRITRHRWEDNIKRGLIDIGCPEDMIRIQLAQKGIGAGLLDCWNIVIIF
jgi:hypothetical protein